MSDTDKGIGYLPRFWGWTDFVPTIPKLYWDVRSQEQRILCIFKLVDKLVNYVDLIASTYNSNEDEITQLKENVAALETSLMDAIAKAKAEAISESEEYTEGQLEDYYTKPEVNALLLSIQHDVSQLQDNIVKLTTIITQIETSNAQWDVQHGYFTTTIDAQRDMFNDVTVHSLTIKELNELDMTVEDLANSGLNIRGLAVMSYWLISKFALPNAYRYFADPESQSNPFTADALKAARVSTNGVVFVPDDSESFESSPEFTADRLKSAKVNKEGYVYVENVNNAALDYDDSNINRKGD